MQDKTQIATTTIIFTTTTTTTNPAILPLVGCQRSWFERYHSDLTTAMIATAAIAVGLIVVLVLEICVVAAVCRRGVLSIHAA